MGALSELPNIGRVLENNLIAAGIKTPEVLAEMGAKDAFVRIRAKDPST